MMRWTVKFCGNPTFLTISSPVTFKTLQKRSELNELRKRGKRVLFKCIGKTRLYFELCLVKCTFDTKHLVQVHPTSCTLKYLYLHHFHLAGRFPSCKVHLLLPYAALGVCNWNLASWQILRVQIQDFCFNKEIP